ncbi:hypothetical protein PR048_027886 [Dryococelus australis]|uniref:Uncharacterized protein n=1 Tax=Dryococelus australis TaxID=614101 RepID=A0ABQ9GHQ0_9NEOP|nr:hypothetical protein PR048_027886 [Dryococelus australis]
MAPKEVTDNSLMKTIYNNVKVIDERKTKFKVGEFICISKQKGFFEKKFNGASAEYHVLHIKGRLSGVWKRMGIDSGTRHVRCQFSVAFTHSLARFPLCIYPNSARPTPTRPCLTLLHARGPTQRCSILISSRWKGTQTSELTKGCISRREQGLVKREGIKEYKTKGNDLLATAFRTDPADTIVNKLDSHSGVRGFSSLSSNPANFSITRSKRLWVGIDCSHATSELKICRGGAGVQTHDPYYKSASLPLSYKGRASTICEAPSRLLETNIFRPSPPMVTTGFMSCLNLKNTLSREHSFAQPGESTAWRSLTFSLCGTETTTLSFPFDVMQQCDAERRENMIY